MYYIFFVSALFLFLPGVFLGLPTANAPDRIKAFGPDELGPLGPAAELYNVFAARRPPFNPQYPLFHYFVDALFVGPYLLWSRLTGGMTAPSPNYPFGFLDPAGALRAMTVLARIPSLLMGAGVVVAAVWTASRLWGRRAGVLAGILTGLQYSMGYYARTSNVDIPALFWLALAVGIVAGVLRDGWTTRSAVLLGLFAALATATKDASYATLAVPGIYLIWRARTPSDRKAVLVAAITALACYALASGVLFHPGRYLAHLRFITQGSPTGLYHAVPATLDGYFTLTAASIQHVLDIAGLPALILAIAGVAACVRTQPRVLILLGVIPWTLFLVVFTARVSLLRFLIPSCWILGLFAARGADALLANRRVLAGSWVAASIVWGILGQADLLWQSYHDTRYAAAEWFREHAKEGDRVMYFKSPEKLPPLPPGVRSIQALGATANLDARPEFVIDVPWETEEIAERLAPKALLASLYNGTAPYSVAAQWQPRSLFSRRPLSFVNPPITVFRRSAP